MKQSQPDWSETRPATVDDYNEMGREVTEDELVAVENAAMSWAPPEE